MRYVLQEVQKAITDHMAALGSEHGYIYAIFQSKQEHSLLLQTTVGEFKLTIEEIK